jgi:aspartate/methionine/tyrosine aminotransferase
VDEDDVLIIDGLTKRFRLPGWRVAWILGPKEFIKASVTPFLPSPTSPAPPSLS